MIKDQYLEKEISNFGEEKIFTVNSVFLSEKKIKDVPENSLVCKTPKGIYILSEEFADDNLYPYQALLFPIAEQIKNGIAVASYNEINIVTIIKNQIPIQSNTIISQSPEAFNMQLNRFMVVNDITTENIVYITEQDYSLKFIKYPFLSFDELKQVEKKAFIKNKVLVFGSLFVLAVYSFSAIPSTIENKKLKNEIQTLEKEKQKIQQEITGNFSSQLKQIDFFKFKDEHIKTDNYIRQIKEIIEKEPILKIKEGKADTLIVTDFSPKVKENLKNYSPENTNKINEIKITLK